MRPAIAIALLLGCHSKPEPAPSPAPSAPAASVAAPAAVAIVDELEDARKKTAELDAMKVHQAAEMHMVRKRGECPSSVAVLVDGGELASAPKDPWGGDYEIICEPGGRVAVVSAGPDRRPKSGDDVVHITPP